MDQRQPNTIANLPKPYRETKFVLVTKHRIALQRITTIPSLVMRTEKNKTKAEVIREFFTQLKF